MSLVTYIDNEVPAFAEWTSISEAGNSTVSQVTDAGFPERGRFGMRIVIDGTSSAYADKNIADTIPAGDDFFFAFWLNTQVLPSATKTIFDVDDAGVAVASVNMTSAGSMSMTVAEDGGSANLGTYVIEVGRWYYIAGRITRAATDVSSDGTAEFWVDNQPYGTLAGKDNFNTFENPIGIQVGFAATGTDGAILDYDEIQTNTTYPEAYAPDPITEYPEIRRTVLLGIDTSDGREFTDYVIQQAGLPRSNVITLPNASTTETLASLAAWNTQVEDDIDAWVALVTGVWAGVTTFLVGYNVPGAFTNAGFRHSATSRLNHYGTAFSSMTANPLASPSTVSRLTVTTLNAAGVYLAMRIDADSLANAKTILDDGLSSGLITELRETDILYTDDDTFRVALDTQHLRIETSDVT